MNREITIQQKNKRIFSLEFRTTGKHLIKSSNDTTAEIVQHVKTHCWTVAYWDLNNDGFHLVFVGDRPFKTNLFIFLWLAQTGQKFLDNQYLKQ